MLSPYDDIRSEVCVSGLVSYSAGPFTVDRVIGIAILLADERAKKYLAGELESYNEWAREYDIQYAMGTNPEWKPPPTVHTESTRIEYCMACIRILKDYFSDGQLVPAVPDRAEHLEAIRLKTCMLASDSGGEPTPISPNADSPKFMYMRIPQDNPHVPKRPCQLAQCFHDLHVSSPKPQESPRLPIPHRDRGGGLWWLPKDDHDPDSTERKDVIEKARRVLNAESPLYSIIFRRGLSEDVLLEKAAAAAERLADGGLSRYQPRRDLRSSVSVPMEGSFGGVVASTKNDID